MSTKFNRWLRSRTGLTVMSLLLIVVLVVAVVIYNQVTTGTPPVAQPAYFPPPPAGVTCLPTCKEDDGKFLMSYGTDMASFINLPNVIWFGVPAQYTDFTIDIFDGDGGLDKNGVANYPGGNWDTNTIETVYTLYADPLKDGSKAFKVGEWRGNALKMPNNQWYSIKVPIDANASLYGKAPSGHYFFRMEIQLDNPNNLKGAIAYKIRSNTYLTTGMSDGLNGQKYYSQIAVQGAKANSADARILYPKYVSPSNPGAETKYSGDWVFTFPVDQRQDYVELWNGDFDDGTSSAAHPDSDDPNTAGKPSWAGSNVRDEAAQGKGDPADDTFVPINVRMPSVVYTVTNPLGNPIYVDSNPSGTEEWEKFSMTSNPAKYPDADVTVQDGFVTGLYQFKIGGLDIGNVVYLRLPVCDKDAGCGPETTDGVCPRTIGYWKNNVEKVLIQNSTNGVQETPESLDKALKFVAELSPLYRKGINVGAPVAIPDPGERLTNDEAYQILMRGAQNVPYPADSQTARARALQQNLATWLNLASGKIGGNTVISLSTNGTVVFEGTVWDALQTAQAIILNPAATEEELLRAKDIGDQINNNNLGEDTTEIETTCDITKIPPDKQKPPRDKYPRQDPPADVPPVLPPTVCSIPNGNLGGGAAIIALNPADCKGQQNGLLFHGTSTTTLYGNAISNGCVRAEGTTKVTVTEGTVQYAVGTKGNKINELITPAPVKGAPVTVQIDPPNCDDPAAHKVDAKDWAGDVTLEPGLYCVSGDLTINAGQRFSGVGVTLYMLNGGVTINGGATVQLEAPMFNGSGTLPIAPALPNILFYVNASDKDTVKIAGNTDSYLEGVVYAPNSEIDVLGTAQVTAPLRSQFIGWDVQVGGTADLFIDYRGSNLPVCTPAP